MGDLSAPVAFLIVTSGVSIARFLKNFRLPRRFRAGISTKGMEARLGPVIEVEDGARMARLKEPVASPSAIRTIPPHGMSGVRGPDQEDRD